MGEKRKRSKRESTKLHKKHGFNQDILRLAVEDLKFDLDVHFDLKINALKHNCKVYREWLSFVCNQKKRDQLYVALIQLKNHLEVC